jgi:hypothetical protein
MDLLFSNYGSIKIVWITYYSPCIVVTTTQRDSSTFQPGRALDGETRHSLTMRILINPNGYVHVADCVHLGTSLLRTSWGRFEAHGARA